MVSGSERPSLPPTPRPKHRAEQAFDLNGDLVNRGTGVAGDPSPSWLWSQLWEWKESLNDQMGFPQPGSERTLGLDLNKKLK